MDDHDFMNFTAGLKAYQTPLPCSPFSIRLSKQPMSSVLKVVMDDYDLVTCTAGLELKRNFGIVFQFSTEGIVHPTSK